MKGQQFVSADRDYAAAEQWALGVKIKIQLKMYLHGYILLLEIKNVDIKSFYKWKQSGNQAPQRVSS